MDPDVRRLATIGGSHLPHMNVLALETSTDRLSLALASDGRIHIHDVEAGQRHAELILTAAASLLRQAALAARDLDAIVYGEGPGSFTGLRIACGVAQGLALAAGARTLGIGTLVAMAEASGEERVIACIDARMGEVYHAAYEKNADGWCAVYGPGLYPPERVPVPAHGTWTGCGSGFAAHREVLQQRHGTRLAAIRADACPQAHAMLRLALPRLQAGEGGDPADAAPVYLRDKVALKTSER